MLPLAFPASPTSPPLPSRGAASEGDWGEREAGRRASGPSGSLGDRRGFSLLEILLVVALLALLATLLVAGSARLLSTRPLTAEDHFWQTVNKAREWALLHNQEVRLSFDPKERHFRLTGSGGEAQILPVALAGEVFIDFLSTQQSRQSILIGGQLLETQTLPFVTFYRDGTCSPFRVQLRTGGAARQLAIDPWTCAPMLKAE